MYGTATGGRAPTRAALPAKQIKIHDDEDDALEAKRRRAAALLRTPWFDLGIAAVISLNATSISVEQSMQIKGEDTTVIQVFESIFLVIYLMELGTRVFVYGCPVFRDNWVKFDAFLIILGILSSWIIEPFLDESPDAFGPLMVLRVGRIMRLGKMMRMFSKFEDFWVLIRSFLNSTNIIVYTFLLLILIMYVFGSLAIELITKHQLNLGAEPDEAFQLHVDKHFGNLPTTMLTLVSFVCMDGMSEIYMPLVEKDWTLSLYFIAVILIIGIVIMNIITSVVFTSILDQNSREQDAFRKGQEREWADIITETKKLFVRLDEDRSGQLSRSEVMNINDADRAKLCAALGVSTPIQVFNALDVDQTGQVSINQFFDAMWEVALSKGGLGMKRMERQIEAIHLHTKESFECQFQTQRQLDLMREEVDFLKKQLVALRKTHGNIGLLHYSSGNMDEIQLESAASNGNTDGHHNGHNGNGLAKKGAAPREAKLKGARAPGADEKGHAGKMDAGVAPEMAGHEGVASVLNGHQVNGNGHTAANVNGNGHKITSASSPKLKLVTKDRHRARQSPRQSPRDSGDAVAPLAGEVARDAVLSPRRSSGMTAQSPPSPSSPAKVSPRRHRARHSPWDSDDAEALSSPSMVQSPPSLSIPAKVAPSRDDKTQAGRANGFGPASIIVGV